ncbi:hypothetical protein E0Z10_g7132 [Xylaria hypoxylon]|uniref:EngB-type G domain-containing protein n=1 Tax=Xylaria hypoxylon TaxID=37992 RepID=A0A4Z0YCG6_9PEZI|nr:hypothetical protein E0Z10_g7132 [Xylaria hypoxylon]
MTRTTSLQLKELLAMPTALRPVLLGAFASSRPRWVKSRSLCVSSSRYGSVKYPNVAAFLVPEFRTSQIVEITPDDLFKTSSLSSAPGQPLEEELTKLYTRNPADFVYAESDFYKLRKNTRVPEVCILGRSNVGKSSFVNALANRPSNALAFVSRKAGKTRSINMYGFGPAPTRKELQAQGSEYKDEELPTHVFHLVDMPGYGHASLKEWGKNIALYLNKRKAVKGAIVLIDAEVGPKDSDFHLLQLLSAAQLKTAIALTKADKVKNGLVGLRETCTKVWDGIHTIEARTTDGNWAWERDVYVTAVGARDSVVAKSTLTTARLAVARLAGLVKDERPNVDRNKRWSGKMISFDDLQYAPGINSVSETDGDTTKKPTQPVWDTPPPSKNASSLPKATSTFADLEHAAKAQHSGQARNNAGFGSQSLTRSRRAHARAFHNTPARSGNRLSDKPTPAELKKLIDDFVKSLKADTPRDEVRCLHEKREKRPPKLFKNSLKKLEERQARRLQRQYPELTDRTRAVFDRRLEIEERRRQPMTAREDQNKLYTGTDWPVADERMNRKDVNQAMGVSEFEAAFAASDGLGSKMKKKK